MKIILASSSPHRKKLLLSLGLDFKTVPSQINENIVKQETKIPQDLVLKLALLKAKAVVKKLKEQNKKDFIVIGADSTAALLTKKGWQLLNKPKNKWQARKMALLLKGKTHNFYTGIAVVDDRGRQKTNVTKTEVTFKNFSNQILSDFVASKIWQGKAGGYDIAKDKTKLIDCFQGSYTNILGLPIKQLTSILSKFDVKIKNNLK